MPLVESETEEINTNLIDLLMIQEYEEAQDK